MRAGNFRYPSLKGDDLWSFNWTTRDLVNSFLEYPGASVRYSTDPDDITGCGILQNQPDYWIRILNGLLENTGSCDFSCMLIHNEDHDAHRRASEEYLEHFYSKLPRQVLPATLEEVLQWLQIRFPAGTHPRQLLELHDPITCHDHVAKAIGQNPYSNWKPPRHWKKNRGHNPSVLCYYGPEARWAAVQGSRLPFQYIDYKAPARFQETGTSPKPILPRIKNWMEKIEKNNGKLFLRVEFEADRSFPSLPLIWWKNPGISTPLQTKNTRILPFKIKRGHNILRIKLA